MKTLLSRLIPAMMAVSLFAAMALTSGCKNTAHGAGEDIENMGESIQEKTD